jgi:hypothetical protein
MSSRIHPLTRALSSLLVVSLVSLPLGVARADDRCPAARNLPQVNIDRVENPAVPIVDSWQILFGDVPLSDAQLAELAKDDPAIDLTRSEMQTRGTWVYVGMLTGALGAAISCAGWLLFGQQGQVKDSVSLPMALGGLAMGAGGMLLVTSSIQTPLEPHLAPTPRHRLSREEARRLVTIVNQRLFDDICQAADAVDPGPPAPAQPFLDRTSP